MQHSVLVTEGRAHEKLVHETPNCVGVEGTAFTVCIHVLFKVPFTVLENEYEFCFCVDDIVKAHDVDVLELFHERDLANRRRWGPLFGVEVYLLESDNFICCPGTTLDKTGGRRGGAEMYKGNQVGIVTPCTLSRTSLRLGRVKELNKTCYQWIYMRTKFLEL
jgi:hypothetical protein